MRSGTHAAVGCGAMISGIWCAVILFDLDGRPSLLGRVRRDIYSLLPGSGMSHRRASWYRHTSRAHGRNASDWTGQRRATETRLADADMIVNSCEDIDVTRELVAQPNVVSSSE
jgi:hypothetical protein